MRRLLFLFIALSFLPAALSLTSCGKAKKYGDAKGQILCPVSAKLINKDFYADYKGQRIYFAGEKAIDEFNKEPAKYMALLAGVKLDDAVDTEKDEEGSEHVKEKPEK